MKQTIIYYRLKPSHGSTDRISHIQIGPWRLPVEEGCQTIGEILYYELWTKNQMPDIRDCDRRFLEFTGLKAIPNDVVVSFYGEDDIRLMENFI